MWTMPSFMQLLPTTMMPLLATPSGTPGLDGVDDAGGLIVGHGEDAVDAARSAKAHQKLPR